MADDSLPIFIRRFADKHPYAFPYGSAVLISVAALLIILVLPYSRQQPVFLFFEVGVALATWVGGWRAGVVSLVGASVASAYLAQQGIDPPAVFRLVLNLVFAVGIIWVVAKLRFSQEALRQSEERFRRLNAELEQRVTDRTAQLQTANEEQRYYVQLLKTVTDNASSALYMVDPAGLGTFVNPALERLTGYRADELIGHVVHDKIHHTRPDRSPYPVHECPLTGAVRHRKTLRGEDLFLREDGTFFPVQYTASPIFRGDIAVGTAIEFRDLTEAKAAQRALQDSEELKRRIIESSTDCIKVLDLDGNLLFMSSGGQQLLEIDDIRPYLNTCWIDFWQPEDWPKISAALAGARAGGIGKFQAFCPSAKGAPRWWEVITTPICNAAGRPEQLLSVSRDVTERKRAEEAKAHVAAIVESSDDAIISKDLQGIIMSWNKGAEKMFGYTAVEAVGQPVTMLFPPHLVEEEPRILESIRRGEKIDHYETVRRRKDGTEINISLTISPIQDDAGNVVGASKIAHDITAAKQAEEALARAQAELAHVTRVATLGEMTASIAHEINQPLGAITNNANATLRWLAANNLDEARRSVEVIRADGHRAGEIIQRIRSFATKGPPQKNWTDINQAIREVIALARSELQRHNVSVETELSADVQLAFADRIQLQQVILNLAMNAAEAMSEVSDGPRQLLLRTGTDAWGGIVITVRDSGPGLRPENLDRLFTPFYTTKPQGMGMGLAICRSIVEAHGGRLWATANDDGGATFQFTLPSVDDRVATSK